MATYSLSGAGLQSLTAGTVALRVTVSTLPAGSASGGANPADYYGLGFLRPGDAAAFWEPFPIIGGPQWMPLPWGTTRIGYTLLNGAAVSVVEVASPSPLAFPLSTLPDVALSSPATGQVLTYTGSNWTNAAPSGGGGSGGGDTVLLNFIATSADITYAPFNSTGGTWNNFGPSKSFTKTSAASIIEIGIGGYASIAAGCGDVGTRLLIDGTTPYSCGGAAAVGGWGNILACSPVIIPGLSVATHTVQVQFRPNSSGQLWCQIPPTPFNGASSFFLQVWQRST